MKPHIDVDFMRMFDDLPTPYMVLDTQLRFIGANQAYLKATNSTLDQILGVYVFDAFPDREERVALFKAAFEKAVEGQRTTVDREPYMLADPDADGGSREVWWTTHQFPLYDTGGAIVGMVQKAVDDTVNYEAERSRDVVLREFDHRMNNILAKVSAIARRTGERYPDMEDFIPRFGSRIEAMAKTQKLLIRTQWSDVNLTELAEQEFAPYRDEDDTRILISGGPVLLDGKIAQSLGMAFHELVTNAAKYGALSVPGGRIELAWTLDEKPDCLVIRWMERGLPQMEAPPADEGFGSIIIGKFLPIETRGSVQREFGKDSMICTISLPYNEH